MTQPIPTFDSWWELNNRSLPVHDPYELARAVAERFSGHPPQQDAGEAYDLKRCLDEALQREAVALNERDQLKAECARLKEVHGTIAGWLSANIEWQGTELAELLTDGFGWIDELRQMGDDELQTARARIAELEGENETLRNAQKACEHCDAETVAEVASLRAALASQQADAGRLQLEKFEQWCEAGRATIAEFRASRTAPPAAASEQGEDAACSECGGSGMIAHFDGEGNELGMDGCGNCQGTGRVAEQPSPSANTVDPGEGWRLLGVETLQAGDEYKFSPEQKFVPIAEDSIGLRPLKWATYRRRITAQEVK